MSENRKEKIIMVILKLAAQKGLQAVSMNMIAEEIGIKKPSLYNHFKSKEELICQMYLFLRDQAKKQIPTKINSDYFNGKTAYEILSELVNNYIFLCTEQNMLMFYKVIYSERVISRDASKILVTETDKMIKATKDIFCILKDKKLMKFKNVDISALNFALTIHSLIDYSFDRSFSSGEQLTINTDLINKYILNFCSEHEFEEVL